MKTLILLTLAVLLSGCIGTDKDGSHYAKTRSIYVDRNRICFSINKSVVLTDYFLSTLGKEAKELLRGRSTHLSYPESCFIVPLERGVVYRVNYTLDNKNYYYSFIIKKDGRKLSLWFDTGCPYLSTMPI